MRFHSFGGQEAPTRASGLDGLLPRPVGKLSRHRPLKSEGGWLRRLGFRAGKRGDPRIRGPVCGDDTGGWIALRACGGTSYSSS